MLLSSIDNERKVGGLNLFHSGFNNEKQRFPKVNIKNKWKFERVYSKLKCFNLVLSYSHLSESKEDKVTTIKFVLNHYVLIVLKVKWTIYQRQKNVKFKKIICKIFGVFFVFRYVRVLYNLKHFFPVHFPQPTQLGE